MLQSVPEWDTELHKANLIAPNWLWRGISIIWSYGIFMSVSYKSKLDSKIIQSKIHLRSYLNTVYFILEIELIELQFCLYWFFMCNGYHDYSAICFIV